MDEKRNVANGKGLKDSISKFERLAKKNPKYYCYIGTSISITPFSKRLLNTTKRRSTKAYRPIYRSTMLGLWRHFKKALEAYEEGAKKNETSCFLRLGGCYQHRYGNIAKINLAKALIFVLSSPT